MTLIMARLKRISESYRTTLTTGMSRGVQLALVAALAAVVVVGAILLSGGGDEQPRRPRRSRQHRRRPTQTLRRDPAERHASRRAEGEGDARGDRRPAVPVLRAVLDDGAADDRARLRPHRQPPLRAALPQLPRARLGARGRRRRRGGERRTGCTSSPTSSTATRAPRIGIRGRRVHPQGRGRCPGLDPDKVVAAADDPLAQPAVRGDEQFARDHRLDRHAGLLPAQGRAADASSQPQGTAPEDYARAIDAALATDPAARHGGARADRHRDRRLPDVGALRRARAGLRRRRRRLRARAVLALGGARRHPGRRARARRLRRDPREPRAARGARRARWRRSSRSSASASAPG